MFISLNFFNDVLVSMHVKNHLIQSPIVIFSVDFPEFNHPKSQFKEKKFLNHGWVVFISIKLRLKFGSE
jgi:hypothetical protein